MLRLKNKNEREIIRIGTKIEQLYKKDIKGK